MEKFTMPNDGNRQQALKTDHTPQHPIGNIYRAIADSLQCGIWVFDQTNNTLYTNAFVTEMLGYSADELVGKNLEMIFADNEAPSPSYLDSELEQQKQFEIALRHRNGQTVWCEIILSSLQDADGSPIGRLAQLKDVTGQKQESTTPPNIDRYYLKLLAQFPKSGVMIFDHDLRFAAVYGNFYRQGLTPADIEGRLVGEVYPKDFADELAIPMRQALQGEIIVMEKPFRDRFHWLIFAPQQQAQGHITHAMVLIQNITERKLAEITLRESEMFYRGIFEAFFDGLIVIVDGVIVDVNAAVEQMTGYKREELVGELPDLIVPPEWAALVRNRIENQHVHLAETGVRRKDGSIIPVETQAAIIPYKGQVARLTAIRDISQRKETEKQIRLLAKVVHDSQAFIALADLDGKILYINPIGRKMAGFEAEEVIAQPDTILIDLFDHEGQTIQRWREQIAEAGTVRCEDRLKSRDGNLIPVERIMSYVYDEHQRPIAITIIANDIHERNQLQAQRLESQRIQIELEQANELRQHKDFFLSVVSHEFRTPLAVIRSSTDILERHYQRLTPEKRQTHFERVFSQIDKLTDMVGDVLLLSRSEMKGIEFLPQHCNIDTFCQDLIANLARAYPKTRVEYVIELPQRSFSVDPYLLEHILWNLLGNGAKYAPDDGQVSLRLSSADNGLRFEIRDNGIGIPSADMEHIFDPFHRASNVGTIIGTGMGLAIVKRFVELHGGFIECTSATGIGTTFTVTISVGAGDDDADSRD
jgi:PAS domain S-box-containing protein